MEVELTDIVTVVRDPTWKYIVGRGTAAVLVKDGTVRSVHHSGKIRTPITGQTEVINVRLNVISVSLDVERVSLNDGANIDVRLSLEIRLTSEKNVWQQIVESYDTSDLRRSLETSLQSLVSSTARSLLATRDHKEASKDEALVGVLAQRLLGASFLQGLGTIVSLLGVVVTPDSAVAEKERIEHELATELAKVESSHAVEAHETRLRNKLEREEQEKQELAHLDLARTLSIPLEALRSPELYAAMLQENQTRWFDLREKVLENAAEAAKLAQVAPALLAVLLQPNNALAAASTTEAGNEELSSSVSRTFWLRRDDSMQRLLSTMGYGHLISGSSAIVLGDARQRTGDVVLVSEEPRRIIEARSELTERFDAARNTVASDLHVVPDPSDLTAFIEQFYAVVTRDTNDEHEGVLVAELRESSDELEITLDVRESSLPAQRIIEGRQTERLRHLKALLPYRDVSVRRT